MKALHTAVLDAKDPIRANVKAVFTDELKGHFENGTFKEFEKQIF